MNRRTASVLLALLFAGFVIVRAGDSGNFKSALITESSGNFTLHVADKHYVRLRNFTQEGGTSRGVVAVATSSGTRSILTATMIDNAQAVSPDPIRKGVIVSGPADLTVAVVTGAKLFLTYIKESELRPTPTPTITPIATVTPTVTATPTP